MISPCEKLALEMGELRLAVSRLREDLDATKADLQERFEGCKCQTTENQAWEEPWP